MLGKILCALHLHKWRLLLGTSEIVSYEKWGRTYRMRGIFYCERECGVDDTARYWDDDGTRSKQNV